MFLHVLACTFKQVDVDVFRRLGPVRDVPLHGAPSFTSEALAKWRELNSAEHFLEVAAAISPMCETLPLLVHHKQEVGILCRVLQPMTCRCGYCLQLVDTASTLMLCFAYH